VEGGFKRALVVVSIVSVVGMGVGGGRRTG
jgi:hypothetical protein